MRVLTTQLPEPPVYLTFFQVSTASMSFLASTIIAFAITCLGNVGLSTPYRRIIFGLSVADILQSLALLTGPFMVPPGKCSGAAGTEVASCKANGFIMSTGATLVVMYTFFLCVYYLYKLKYRMTDNAFRHKIETKCHAFIVVFCVAVNITALGMDTIHTSAFLRSFCAINSTPTGCRKHPDIVGECDPTTRKRADHLIFVTVVSLPIICLVGITFAMASLYHHAYVLNQTIEQELQLSIQTPTSLRSGIRRDGSSRRSIARDGSLRTNTPREGGSVRTSTTREDSLRISDPRGGSALATVEEPEDEAAMETPQDKVQQLSRLYRREMMIQATCYVGAFCITYIPMVICVFLTIYTENPLIISSIVMFTFPLGGFLNILVYTRPKIASLRRNHPECSRLRGFWLVLRAGGEIPSEDDDLFFNCCRDCSCLSAWFESEYDYVYPATPNRVIDKKIHVSRIDF